MTLSSSSSSWYHRPVHSYRPRSCVVVRSSLFQSSFVGRPLVSSSDPSLDCIRDYESFGSSAWRRSECFEWEQHLEVGQGLCKEGRCESADARRDLSYVDLLTGLPSLSPPANHAPPFLSSSDCTNPINFLSSGSTKLATTPLQMADTKGRTKKGACVGTTENTSFITHTGIKEASAK